jgi:hypothetical protein
MRNPMSYRRFLLTLVIALSRTCPAQSAEAELEKRLDAQVESYSISAGNLLEALAQVSDDFQLPMGIEWEVASQRDGALSIRYARTTALRILQELIGRSPDYVLTRENGVVHVANKAIHDDARNFLNLRIREFELSSEYVLHANNRLQKIVLQLVNHLPDAEAQYGCAGSFGVSAGDRMASFRMQDVTVRDILDRFLTSSGHGLWLVTFPDTEASALGFFRTTSVFSPDLPEDRLPTWDFLPPGYDPVRKGFGIGWPRVEWRPLIPGVKN